MNRFGKVISFALATTMVLGSAFTSLASEPSTRTQTSTGVGTPAGYVDMKNVSEITLPVVDAETSPFNYIMDPQRLISGTYHAKYEHSIFPVGESDTGVYFDNGIDTNAVPAANALRVYDSSSIKSTVTNKSNTNILVTVKAEAVSNGTKDMPLVTEEAYRTAQGNIDQGADPCLYLGLVCTNNAGTMMESERRAILKDVPAELSVMVLGNEHNFTLVYDPTTDKYVNTMNDNVEEGSWNTMDFNLEGAVTNKAVPNGTTAPNVKVTWSWEDPTMMRVVTFNTGVEGVEIDPQRVAIGEKVSKPEDPIREADAVYNYEFEGWYIDEDCTIAFDFDTYVITEETDAEGLELFAKWTPTDYISENVRLLPWNTTAGYYLTKQPGFDPEAEVGMVLVNGMEIVPDDLFYSEYGNLCIYRRGLPDALDGSYVVRAIIGGVGYTATYTLQ